MNILSVFSALHSGEYETVQEGLKFLNYDIVGHYVGQFCKDGKELYEKLFINQKTTLEERTRMERKLNLTGFSGCVGVLEGARIKSVWERKENHSLEPRKKQSVKNENSSLRFGLI